VNNPDLQYAFTVTGAATMFAIAWWVVCFVLRNGIDGLKRALRAIGDRRWPDARRLFLGSWK